MDKVVIYSAVALVAVIVFAQLVAGMQGIAADAGAAMGDALINGQPLDLTFGAKFEKP